MDAEDEAVRQAYQEGLWKDVFVKWPQEYAEYNDSDMNRGSFGPDRTLLAIVSPALPCRITLSSMLCLAG